MALLILSTILLAFTVVGTGALSGLVSERAGVMNVAIEGFMLFGALIYSLLSIIAGKIGASGVAMQIPLFLISMIITMFISSIHAYACITLKVNQVISGMAINLLATGVALFIVFSGFQAGISGLSNIVKDGSLKKFGLTIGLLITIILFGCAFFILKKTKYGLHLITAGENPNALESQGISVIKTRYQAVLIAGALGGLAGAFFVQWKGTFHASVEGLGYISLAILIFGRWRIEWVLAASIFFSALTGLVMASLSSLDISPWFANNSNLIRSIPFIVSLGAIIALAKRSRGPKANGIPYERSAR